MQPTESAVLVPIPEAERVVGRLRSGLDPASDLGVPAHVTVLCPFVAPESIDEGVISTLAGAIRSIAAFDVSFARLRWFGQTVLWLDPQPARPFVDLTEAAWQLFPDCPPYGGAHAETIPHLTIGYEQPVEALRAAEQAIEPDLPIMARVTAAVLMQGSSQSGSWHTVAVLPLRSPAPR